MTDRFDDWQRENGMQPTRLENGDEVAMTGTREQETRTLQTFTYEVTVQAYSRDEADTVMVERIGPDEDYGFTYTVNARPTS